MRNQIIFYLNGQKIEVPQEQIFMNLAEFIRSRGLVGTKIVCAEGDCGACSVLISPIQQNHYQLVDSCIIPLYRMDGYHVITVEGISEKDQLSPIQKAIYESHGSQCGFCTPGMVMAMTFLFENKTKIDSRAIRDSLTGNLCRCTGYESLIQAAQLATKYKYVPLSKKYPQRLFKESIKLLKTPLSVQSEKGSVVAPTNLKSLLTLKKKFPEAKLSGGLTDLGVMANKKKFHFHQILNTQSIPNLKFIKKQKGYWEIGLGVTLSELEHFSQKHIPEFAKLLKVFASPQIKNIATLIGNVANGSPIGDTLPFLYVINASVVIQSVRRKREILIKNLFKGYKNLDLKKDEVITHLRIPLKDLKDSLKIYKISKRRDLDISTFSCAIRIRKKKNIIQEASLAFGGVGPTVLELKKTQEFLKEALWNLESFEEAGQIAVTEITPISDVRGDRQYRLWLAERILKKFYYEMEGVQ